MQAPLKLHPASRCSAASHISVDVARAANGLLTLRYTLAGKIVDLRLPAPKAPARTDDLWQYTCFEAFVATPKPGYFEFNFAPSTAWAAYRFSGYREGMAPATETGDPRISAAQTDERLTLDATVDLGAIAASPWRLALSAVIEETNGNKSYWALTHPAGKPDFHHPNCFTLEIAPP